MSQPFEHAEPDYRLLAIAAARLRSEGQTQHQIAHRLGKSQPEVSRLLAFAEKHGFLARAPSFLSQNIKPDELREADRRFFVNEELRQLLGRRAPAGLHLSVQVLPEGDEEFAAAAAGCVARLLLRSRIAGVMWGRTVQRLVARIGEHRECFDQAGGCQAQCVPLCGDPVHLMNLGLAKYSASHLAAELGHAISPGRASDQPCLIGVPAYLSRRFFLKRGEVRLNWEDFVQEIPGYRAIFGPNHSRERPWVERLDMILTGMGIIALQPRGRERAETAPATAAHEEIADFARERLSQEEDLTAAKLAQLAFGDIGGWLIERPGLRAPDQRLVESLNQGWTGVKDRHFARVAGNASPDGAPGVILVAAGPAKAKMLTELVRRGLVNELLIDSTLAAALRP